MNPQQPKALRATITGATLFVWLTAINAPAAEPPKPTPRPGTLGAYAESVTLNRSAVGDESGHLVLTNANVVTIGAGGAVIFGAVTTDGRADSSTGGAADAAERNRWRAAYRNQQRVIANLERRRSQLEIEIDHIERLRLTVKTMARLQRAEEKLRDLDRQIENERQELSRIVRDARHRGAEPGWFR